MTAESGAHGWCSLRLRFEERELELLRAAEKVRGAVLARDGRPAELRGALRLAKVGQKVTRAAPGAIVVLDENELALLLEAVRDAIPRVQAAVRPSAEDVERNAVMGAFPELVEKGSWRAFGLTRELEALIARLEAALKGN